MGSHYRGLNCKIRVHIAISSSVIEGNTNSENLTHRRSNCTFATSDLVISFLEPSARLTCVRRVR